MSAAEKILQQHHRERTALIILFMDIDGFKRINDNFGHHEGDRALAMFAGVLNETFRIYDICARIGGDEFVVLMPNCSLSYGESSIARLASALTHLTTSKQLAYSLRCSVGFACYDGNHEPDLSRLLSQADQDMYGKKRS
ncbi:putative diguanylate cyclase YedQ [compost metagenome]